MIAARLHASRFAAAACLVGQLCLAIVCASLASVVVGQNPEGDAVPNLATIEEATATQRASLERAQQLLVDGQAEEAVETLRRVMDADGDRLLPLTDVWEREVGFDRWLPVRALGHWRLAGWASSHPAAIELYRQRVDALAERWYRQALDERDETLLERLIEQLMMSRRGDDALLAWGDWALERGDFAAARGAWQQISPLLRTPLITSTAARTPPGRPWWLAMAAGRYTESPQVWQELFDAPGDHPRWLAYPDTDLNLADVRARFVLASIHERAWRRVELELAWFRHYHATARGRLAGREGVWVDLLTDLLQRAREWPARDAALLPGADQAAEKDDAKQTLAATGNAAAPGVNGRDATGPTVDLPGAVTWRWPPAPTKVDSPEKPVERERRVPADIVMSSPVVVASQVVFVSQASLVALDARNGLPAFDHRREAIHPQAPVGEVYYLSTPGLEREDEGAVIGRLPGWVAAEGSRVFAILGGGTFRRGNRSAVDVLPAALIGIDMAEQAKVFLNVSLAGDEWQAEWHWAGRPLATEGLVFAPVQRTDGVRSELHVAAFDARTGRLRWRKFVSSGETPSRGDVPNACLAVHGRDLYCQSNGGTIACLSTTSGKLRWLVRYTRDLETDSTIEGPASRVRTGLSDSPPLAWSDQLFASPTDGERVFSLDANTGQVLWATPRHAFKDGLRWLGVAGEQASASGDSVTWFDVATGLPLGEFPAGGRERAPGHARTGPRGTGRGLWIGAALWWPTRDEILVFRQRTQATPSGWVPQAVARLDLRSRGTSGGDLMIVGNVLLIHGRKGLEAFVCP